jgi:hypothetical protein
MTRDKAKVHLLIELYSSLGRDNDLFNKSLGEFIELDNVPVYNQLERLEVKLRDELGMPAEDEDGVFLFDYYFDLIYAVEQGRLTIEQIIDEFINWDKMED